MARKWIVSNDKLLMGNVEYHYHLLAQTNTPNCGGGLWHYDADNKLVYLYGGSLDYGNCSADSLSDALHKNGPPMQYEDCTFVHCYDPVLKSIIDGTTRLTITHIFPTAWQ